MRTAHGASPRLAASEAAADVRFHPQLVVTADGGARADGVITDSFLPSPSDPAGTRAGSWIALFRRVRDQVMPRMPFTAAVVYGMSAAYEFTAALFRTGPDPTRGGLISALTGLPQGPAVAPLAFGTSDHVGVTGGYVGVLHGGVLSPVTGVLTASDSSAGMAVLGAASQPAAPASGLPPH